MLTKRPNLVTHDLHKKALGCSNPWNLKQAKLSQPTLYDGYALLNPTHTSVIVHDSEDSLVHVEKELSQEQVYWLPAEELATQKSNPPKPVTLFVRTRPAKSQISTCLQGLNSLIPAFAHVIHQQTDPCRYPSGSREIKPVKAMFTEQIIPFYENVKQLVQKLNANIVTEVTEYMWIFDELDTDSNCLCEELRSNCDREHSKVVELEAEILKKQQMLNESEKRCAFIEKNHVNLQVKFQKYKECLQNQMVCDNTNSTTSNEIFEINKLKDQLQGKDDTIRNLQTQINITRMLNVGSTVGSFDKQALETELTQLKDAITSVRIQNDGFKAENVNLKRRYEELSKSNAYSRSTFTAKINALTLVQVLMALADDELSVGKNHACNGEWIDITMKKVNILLSMDEDSDWQNYLKYINIDLNKYQTKKKKILSGEQLTKSSSKNDAKNNPFVPASLDYDHEMVPKFKDWVERLNPDNKLPNFNTGRILVPESEAVNECLQLTEASSNPESSKESSTELQTPLPPLKYP
ncbi:hypothetical protein Tco_0599135 [Tanacetum coccineum]